MGRLPGHRHYRVYSLEGGHILEKIIFRTAHLPTLLLLAGYPVFWLELYVLKGGMGKTSPLALFIFLILALLYVRRDIHIDSPFFRGSALEKTKINSSAKFLLGFASFITFLILLCVFYASLYPPHLVQEWDAIHYHITLPRQHLILGSFQFIPWAADDLFLLPIQFSLAPYWLATPLPNKFPQFIFVLGLVFVSINLVNYLRVNKSLSALMIVFAILGSHHIGVQMGTAMLDLVICYLFLAAVDSFLRGNVFMAAAEFAFFLWSKSAIPIQMAFFALLMLMICVILKKVGLPVVKLGFSQYMDSSMRTKYLKTFRQTLIGFMVLSLFVGGPFVAKSLYYSGTPLFPFFPDIVPTKSINKNIDYNSRGWESLLRASRYWTGALNRNSHEYKDKRTLLNFLKHLWLIAVPEKGVNNRFDYPVGLMYLIFLAPFLHMSFRDFRKKELGIIPVFIMVFWLLWWMGTQETRYLYIPIILIFLVVLSEIKNYSPILLGVVLIALALNALSIFRAHKRDFVLPAQEVLRERDLEILKLNREYIEEKKRDMVDLDFHDVAFAQFPVRVTKEALPHTLAL